MGNEAADDPLLRDIFLYVLKKENGVPTLKKKNIKMFRGIKFVKLTLFMFKLT